MGGKVEFNAQPGKQEIFLTTPSDVAIYGGARGGGKAQPLDAPVLTPKGWFRIGDLKIGSNVIDPTTGGHSEVIGIFPQGEKQVYEIICDDGARCEVGVDHLWAFRLSNHKKPNTKSSKQREFIRKKLESTEVGNKWTQFKVGTTAHLISEIERGNKIRIPLTEPVLFTVNGRVGIGPIDPYLAGVFLGDGCCKNFTVTSCDNDVRSALLLFGFSAHEIFHSDGISKQYGACGLVRKNLKEWLANHGMKDCLSHEKITPPYVLTAPIDYRLSFLQGLLDTDGTVDERGRCYFISTSENLSCGVADIVRSLGGKARIRKRQTYYRYLGEKKKGKPSYQVRIWFQKLSLFFRSKKKQERCTDSWNGGYDLSREIVSIYPSRKSQTVCIKVSSVYGLYVTSDYIVTHNTYALLLEGLRNTRVNGFNSVMFRRTFPQIEQEDGLLQTSKKIYPYAKATLHSGKMLWTFPSSATVRFSHMENPDDKLDWLGASIALICFDELVTFEEDQFWFMLGTNRTTCGVSPYMRCTTNPKADSWVSRLIQWWWDPETGYPIEERSGRIRWFVRIDGTIEWGDSREELLERFSDSDPLSLTFIPARVTDNKILLEKDPRYLGKLKAMSIVDRERYLLGNWKISEAASKYFKRHWFQVLSEAPSGIRLFCRFWDIAATEPSKKNKEPDWTAGVLIGFKDGIWYILDVQRFRGRPAEVERVVRHCAEIDPFGTKIRMEQEPGASGVTVIDHYQRFILPGFNFKGIPSLKNKQLRAGPFSAAAEAGNVKLIRAPWNMVYLDEMENFRGLDEKNDQVDASTGGMNELRGSAGDWKFALPVNTTPKFSPLAIGGFKGGYIPIGR